MQLHVTLAYVFIPFPLFPFLSPQCSALSCKFFGAGIYPAYSVKCHGPNSIVMTTMVVMGKLMVHDSGTIFFLAGSKASPVYYMQKVLHPKHHYVFLAKFRETKQYQKRTKTCGLVLFLWILPDIHA